MDKFKMYQKAYSVKTLYNMFYEDVPEIDFNDDMQRGEVWDNARKSLYIHSILLKITDAQSPFIAGVRELPNGNQVLKIFDGKQRGTTLIHFINNDFKLTKLTGEPEIILDGNPVKLQGRRFSQLPEKIQRWICDTTINISIMENATPEQEALIFRRLNNGKSMSRFDLARSFKSDMSDIRALEKHELISVIFTEKAIDAYKHHEFIVKSWITLFENEPNLGQQHITEVMKVLNMSDGELEQLKEIYDFMFNVYKILNIDAENTETIKMMFKPTHFVGYIPFISEFDTAEQFSEWIKIFFANMSDEYKFLSREHLGEASNIKRRKEIIEESIKQFLGK